VSAQLSLFGPELRRRRLAAGLSLTQLSELIHYSKSYLSKIETGLKPAGAPLARRCDAALGAGGELSALIARPESPRLAALDPVDDGEVWVVSLAADGTGVFLPMRRRDVLSLGTRSLLGISLTARATRAVARHPDGSAMGTFRSLFDHSRRLGQLVAPALVLPSVITMTHALRDMARTAAGATQGEPLLLAGRCAEYAGWMAQEAGDDRAAAWWTDRATEFADAAGDTDLAAYTFVRRAEIALYHDDAQRTIALARQAQLRPGTGARVRGLAAQREAQGHAIAGDYDRCRRLLDLAAGLLGAAGAPATSPGPALGLLGPASGLAAGLPLGSSTVSNQDEVVTAWCLHELGRPQDAAEILDREVPRIPETGRRAWARFGVRRALAHAEAGDIDEACALTGELLDPVDAVDSATIRLDLRRVSRTLARWHGNESVRGLYPRLTAALH
jgi:Helix-turn-helix domain